MSEATGINLDTTVASLNATVSGTGSLLKTGPGTLVLAGANTFSGTTTIQAGILRAAIKDQAFGSNSGGSGPESAVAEVTVSVAAAA